MAIISKWAKSILLGGLVGLVITPRAAAQEVIMVTVEGSAPMRANTQEQARSRAIENAERTAVAESLATSITVDTLLVNLRLSGSILGAIPYGKVVSKKILEEGTVKPDGEGTNPPELLYRVQLEAGVVQQTGGQDPTFYLDAGINQSVFKDGDELEIHIRSTKDCYFAIYNILEDEKIIRLLPNYLSTKNHLAGNEHFTFPAEEDREKGLKLKVHLPEDRQTVTESIYILALAHPFELKSMQVQEGIFGVFDGRTAFMKDLIREVVSIPLKDRAEALLQYEIRKNKKAI